MALEKPTGLTATTISPYRIDLYWKNEDRYHVVQVWRQREAEGWVKIEELSSSDEYYQSSGLDPNGVLYTYYVVGETIEPPETSPESDEANNDTFFLLQAPSDCVVVAFADFIEITWRDNSEEEDDFYIYRQVNGGGYPAEDSPTHIVAANMEFYRDETGITPGSIYEYKIKAFKAGPSYSGYSDPSSAVALSTPTAPDTLVIAEKTDTTMLLTWEDKSNNETGFIVELSDDGDFGDAEITRVIGANITQFLFTGLTPGATYHFRACAYNGVGSSSWTASASGAADATYVLTELEEWIRDPNIEPVYLAEIYTKMTLATFTPTAGKDKTFEREIDASDRGIDILEVFEGDKVTDPDNPTYVSYTAVADAAAVQATAKTFHFAYASRILYVHTSDDSDPDAGPFLIEVAFWLYFSTHKDKEFTVNGRLNHYPNYLSTEDIPDITQEIKPYFEGNFSISSGSIAFKNSGGFFDKIFATYTWMNAKIILKVGKDTFAYEVFKEIFTGYVDSKSCNDKKITFQLRDIRQDMEQKLVLNRYATEDFGNPEDENIGEPIPVCFGYKEKVAPICVDWTNWKFNYHDGRSKSVTKVWKNGVEQTEGYAEDYYVDLQRSIITFKKDSLEEQDVIEIDFFGIVDSANELINNHAEVFKYIMNTYRGLADSRLNLDSIYEAKYANTDELSVFLYDDTPYDEIIRNIEHSGRSFTFQDALGRLGIRPQQTVAASNVKYVVSSHIFDHSQNKNRSSLFWKVNVDYSENPQSQKWKTKTAIKNEIYWKYDITKELDISTYFAASVPAESLAASVLNLLNKEQIEGGLPMLLFDVMAGDLIKFSRVRFYDSDGTASEITLRVIKISKSPASGKTSITAEVV